MPNIRIVAISHSACRFISSSSTSYKNYAARESKFLSKLISKSEPKRKWYKDRPNSAVNNIDIDNHNKKLTSFHVQRRVAVLNKLFMKYITDLMSTGQIASKILEHKIEVTHVTLSPDFQIANVFWTHEKINDKNWLTTTEQMLQNCAFTLRHELSQLRVISHVPPIQFVKDKTYSLAKEVEDRLAIADFGEDYKHPTLTLDQTVCISSPSDIDDETLKSDVANDDEILKTTNFEIVLPQMKHDVLGLDHHNIMSKIKNDLNKLKCASKDNTIYRTSTSIKMDILTDENQQELFTQFLKKRQIQEKRRHRLKNSREFKTNPVYTDVETCDHYNDTQTSFDETFDYNENTYEDEIDKYDASI